MFSNNADLSVLYSSALELIAGRHINLADFEKRERWLSEWRSRAPSDIFMLDELLVQALFDLGASDSLVYVDAPEASLPAIENEGFGFELGVFPASRDEPQSVRLVTVIRGGPAWTKGLKSGDRIESINGEDVSEATPDSLINLNQLQEVYLSVLDDSTGEAQVVRLEREAYLRPCCTSSDNGLGYLSLNIEYLGEQAEFEILSELGRASEYECLLLDLSGCIGHDQELAGELALRLIEAGTILEVTSRFGLTTRNSGLLAGRQLCINYSGISGESPDTIEYSLERAPLCLEPQKPIIAIIDEATGVAGLLLAAILRANRRAVIIGPSRSLDLLVYENHELGGGRSINLAVGRLLPGGSDESLLLPQISSAGDLPQSPLTMPWQVSLAHRMAADMASQSRRARLEHSLFASGSRI